MLCSWMVLVPSCLDVGWNCVRAAVPAVVWAGAPKGVAGAAPKAGAGAAI